MQRKLQIISEGPVAVFNAQYAAVFAMPMTGCQAIGTLAAADIDVPDDPLPDSPGRRGGLNDFTDKFMSWNAAIRIISLHQLQIGAAYACQSNFDKGLILEQLGLRYIFTEAQKQVFKPDRPHLAIPFHR